MIKKNKYDTLSTGIAIGIIIPLIILVIMIIVRKGEHSFFDYLAEVTRLRILPKLLSLCLIPNLASFFIFLRINMLRAGRGVLLSMFFAGLFIVIFKII